MEGITTGTRARAVHRLSFRGVVVSLQCKRESDEIVSRSFRFSRENNAFVAVGADDVSVPCKTRPADADVVTCACVFDLQSRVSAPFVLVETRDAGGNYTYSLIALSGPVTGETRVTFDLPYRLRGEVHVVHGPAVWWTHAGLGFCTAAPLHGAGAGDARPKPIPLSRPVVGVLPLHKGDQVFMIGAVADQCRKGLSGAETLGHALAGPSRGYWLASGDAFDATVLLPYAYVSITRAIWVLCAEKVDGVLKKTSAVAATCEKQLVYFENGVPKEVCQLPFDGPEDLHIVDTGRNGLLIAVCFDQGHVCAIWKDTFQAGFAFNIRTGVAAHWSAVRSAHVDDFLGCGTEQLLLVFEEDDRTRHQLGHFLLTDLCGITFSSGQRNRTDTASHPAADNYLLTFQALESRLQSGLTVVQALQRDVTLKERVVLQAVQALTDIVSGRDPALTHHEQEGLFSLWDEDEEPEGAEVQDEEMQVTSACHTASSRPQVERLWHRFVDDSLVVGAMLTVDSSIPVDCVSLSILTNARPGPPPAVIQTRSQVFWLSTPASSSPTSDLAEVGEPAAKRSKGDDDGGPGQTTTTTTTAPSPRRLAVTGVTRLTSVLSWGRVKCPVMLHYIQRGRAPVDKATQVAFQCGQVSVDIRTDFHSRLLADPKLTTEEDLLSGLSALDRWVFHVDSPQHSLGDMEHCMQRAACCERLKVNPQYLVANSRGPSAAMLLRWRPASRFRGELSVHASQLQMLQFLECLCRFLLASCTIRHLKETGTSREASRVLCLALENEALALKRVASSLLGGEEELRGGGGRGATLPWQPDDSPTADERHRRRRQEWEQDLGWSRRRLSPPVDTALYRTLTRGLTEVRLQADVTGLLLQNQAASWDSRQQQISLVADRDLLGVTALSLSVILRLILFDTQPGHFQLFGEQEHLTQWTSGTAVWCLLLH
ncbi:Fanconi anemia group B protein [Merluccius polli]|uniref:Fanconi anemia group B protein n=1 Tax=Merluccius polli TaxID=89951 RepID=A0AA47M1A4_MERPO|nr:Fanconi anemia group B protein [Merluccius polli]